MESEHVRFVGEGEHEQRWEVVTTEDNRGFMAEVIGMFCDDAKMIVKELTTLVE